MLLSEGRLKISYDDIISAVDDIFTNWIQAMKYRWKNSVDHKGRSMLKSKSHLVTFPENILVSL